MYSKGLTQEQVGDVFNDIYGEHYSKASISRMMEYLRRALKKGNVSQVIDNTIFGTT